MTSYTGKEISSLRIGTVTAVRGRRIDITVDVDKNDSSLIFQGEIISNVSIGSFLVVRRGYAHLVVQVDEEELIESSAWENSDYQRDVDRNTRILKTSLLGEFQKDTSVSPFQTHFVSGSQTSPLIGNIAYLASPEQTSKIYVSSFKPNTQITIGHLASDSTIPINLDINTLFSGHIGIFGTTGSGKSYTLTQLYTQLFTKLKQTKSSRTLLTNSHFLLFDFNGEYCSSHSDQVLCEDAFRIVYGPANSGTMGNCPKYAHIPLDYKILNDKDFWFTLLEASEQIQRPFILSALRRLLDNFDLASQIHAIFIQFFTVLHEHATEVNHLFDFLVSVHHLTPQWNHDFLNILDSFRNELRFHTGTQSFHIKTATGYTYPSDPNFRRELNNIFASLFPQGFLPNLSDLSLFTIKVKIRFMEEIISSIANENTLHPLMLRLDNCVHMLRSWFTFTSKSETPHHLLEIINLKFASLDERQLIPLIVTRAKYVEHKRLQTSSKGSHYLNIIIEEAHNILSREVNLASDSWRNTRLETFEIIIKEGRKFGVFITLASQRPAEISPTISSQLHHYFLHRLISSVDLGSVKNAVTFIDGKSFESIPLLPCGTCIISGTSVQIPAIVKIDELPAERRPDNETIDLVKLWGLASDSSKEAANTEVGSVDTQESESPAEES
ncbi:ATP-binding protein [Schaalia odontolytica]|uniref:DUF87 domain-containing protein n=1 Tax=Schaalia odontolytica TaxID=1660 RepID=A0A857A6V4_9ACTO|nr:ATP-binding protein [Schaalia odontolytica]QGS10195.1 DUF87 domain-containing protein [Schaalia odontolytica]